MLEGCLAIPCIQNGGGRDCSEDSPTLALIKLSIEARDERLSITINGSSFYREGLSKYSNGNVRRGKIYKTGIAAQGSWVDYYENGTAKRGMLFERSYRYSVNGSFYNFSNKSGTLVEQHPTGKAQSVMLSKNTEIQGCIWEGYSSEKGDNSPRTEFHPNGQLKSGRLVYPANIQGVDFSIGQLVNFEVDGRLQR